MRAAAAATGGALSRRCQSRERASRHAASRVEGSRVGCVPEIDVSAYVRVMAPTEPVAPGELAVIALAVVDARNDGDGVEAAPTLGSRVSRSTAHRARPTAKRSRSGVPRRFGVDRRTNRRAHRSSSRVQSQDVSAGSPSRTRTGRHAGSLARRIVRTLRDASGHALAACAQRLRHGSDDRHWRSSLHRCNCRCLCNG